MNTNPPILSLGVDIGSTTIKLVLADGATIVHSQYLRHQSDVRGTLVRCLEQLRADYPETSRTTAHHGVGRTFRRSGHPRRFRSGSRSRNRSRTAVSARNGRRHRTGWGGRQDHLT